MCLCVCMSVSMCMCVYVCVCVYLQYCAGGKIETNEMGRACGTYGGG
jgi:hypothetical protein